MNKKFLYRDKSNLYAQQNRQSAFDYAKMSQQAYDDIVKETAFYNDSLVGGKWKRMMSFEPRGLPVYQKPVLPEIKIDTVGGWGISVMGSGAGETIRNEQILATWPSKQQFFVDVYLKNNSALAWTASTSTPWIKLSQISGKLSPVFGQKESRILAAIDWDLVPANQKASGAIAFKAAGRQYMVTVSADNTNRASLAGYKGFIEQNGYVSMYASNYSSLSNRPSERWSVINGLGLAGNTLQAVSTNPDYKAPATTPTFESKNSPIAIYHFQTLTSAEPKISIYTLPTHPINKQYSMRYGISVDDGPIQVTDFRTFGRSEEWKQNVLRNSAIRSFQMPTLTPGKHTLKIYMVDPGVILDRIIIDLGTNVKAYGLLPETRID